MIEVRRATLQDAELLAAMNRELIEDEGFNSHFTDEQLLERMRRFLTVDYRGIVFTDDGQDVGYALYRQSADAYFPEHVEVTIFQYFIRREVRGRRYGTTAFERMVAEFPENAHISLSVAFHNEPGQAFWESLGFKPHSVVMKRPVVPGTHPPSAEIRTIYS